MIGVVAGVGSACALLLSVQPPAVAGRPTDGAKCHVDLYGSTCEVSVNRPGKPGRHIRASGGNGSGKSAVVSVGRPDPDPCRYVLYEPQPPKSDPIWGGHTTGAIYSYICEQSED